MAKFKQIIEQNLIREKQILFNGGADYNQAVFLAGGSGSGKSFASKRFMQGEKLRRFDVDRWKKDFSILHMKQTNIQSLKGLTFKTLPT